MKKSTVLAKLLAGILALVMAFGVFAPIGDVFTAAKAASVDPVDGSITYGSNVSSLVLNKDAWLAADGTYCIDLTAYRTGEKQITSIEAPAPTDFIIVVDQSCMMRDCYSYNNCYTFYTYKLSAVKSLARALVDEVRDLANENNADHRIGVVAFGGVGTSCYNSYKSTTGLFDTAGNWHDYQFSFGPYYYDRAQLFYDDALVSVNTQLGYEALLRDINTFTYSSGGYTNAGMDMARGIIQATRDDSYTVVNPDGSTTSVPRKKVVVVLTDGTTGVDGFDMAIGTDAANIATDIKKNYDAKIFSVKFDTASEEFTTAYNINLALDYYDWFSASYGYNNDSAPINRYAYNPANGTANGLFTSAKYAALRANNEEFFSRDFTTILSSAYPCTEESGPNGPITAEYLTNVTAYSRVGQSSSGATDYNWFPRYSVSGTGSNYSYVYNTHVKRQKSIGYFYKEGSTNKLITGLYDNNVRNYNNRIPYNNHPVDKVADPAYGKYFINVPNASVLVSGYYNQPTQALKNIVNTIVSEIPESTSFSQSTEIETVGEAYIKDIISEYFVYHDSFDINTNVHTFTQDVIGYENGEYIFSNDLVSYDQYSNVYFDGKDVVKVSGFDYDANVCYKDSTVHGKKFIVQIRGLLAKPTTLGDDIPISNTATQTSGIYSVSGTPGTNPGDPGTNPGDPGTNPGTDPVVPGGAPGSPLNDVQIGDLIMWRGKNKIPPFRTNPADANISVVWSSSNPNAATVDPNTGLVSSHNTGTSTLTAQITDLVTGNTMTKTATVTVKSNAVVPSLSFIIVNRMDVAVGGSKLPDVFESPSDADYSIAWSVDDPTVASVDPASGLVTGLKPGTTMLRARVTEHNGTVYTPSTLITVFGGDNGGTNPGTDPGTNPGTPIGTDPGSDSDTLLVVGGKEAVFPVPYVSLRDKHIVYDFSLKIQDDDALAFFEKDYASHDVAHVLTIDDAYVQQAKRANGEGYDYHGTYPYDNVKHADYFDHFEVGIAEIDEHGEHHHFDKNCHAHVIIKSMNGEKYDVATLLQLTSTRRDIITGEMKTVYEWCRVFFLPATNVHYEESLFTYKNSSGYNAAWTDVGRPNGPTYDATTRAMLDEDTKYDNAFQSTENDLYGHDAEYHNNYIDGRQRDTHEDSNGRSMSVKVDAALEQKVNGRTASWPNVTFKFRGTGIDLISRTGLDTGLFVLDIVPADKSYNYGTGAAKGEDFVHALVNTFYSDGLLYQIPVFHTQDLAWLEQGYKARLQAVYYASYDKQSKSYNPTRSGFVSDLPGLEEGITYEVIDACTSSNENIVPTRSAGSFTSYVDSIRVYNPHTAKLASHELEGHLYYEANEHNPEYNEVRNRLINAGSFNGPTDRVSGIVYIDASSGTAVTIEDYSKFGPNNEAYLTPGNGFAFTVKEFEKNNTELHISAKSPNAKNVIMSVNGVKYSVDSATELYFDVTNAVREDGRVIITCSDIGGTPDAVLSVCQVKVVSDAPQPTRNGGSSLYVDNETLEHAGIVVETESEGSFEALPAPTNVNPAIMNRMPSITWSAVENAIGYEVWRMPQGGTFELAATVTETSYLDEAELIVGTKYYYKVRALDAYNNVNPFCGAVNVTIPALTAPTGLTGKISARKPVITWKAASYAVKYEVWRAPLGGSYERVATVTGTGFTDNGAFAGGAKLYYKIKSVDARGYVSEFTANFAGVTIPTLAAPTGITVKLSARMPVISWRAASNAVKYQVWRAPLGGSYELVDTVTARSYTDRSVLEGGKNYYYRVKSVDVNGFASNLSSTYGGVTVPKLAAPTGLTAKLTDRKPVVTWKAASYAVKYEVWRAPLGGSYQLVATVTGRTFTDISALDCGMKYYYKVKAVDATGAVSDFSSTFAGITFPTLAAPKSVMVQIDNGIPVVTWIATTYATRYAVYRSTAVDGEYDCIGVTSGVSLADVDELEPGTYYYKVRALDDFNNLSAFSAVATAVISE